VNGDLLKRATWALSVEADAAPAPAPATRARVLLRLAARRRRPGRRVGLVLGSVLLLSGSLALATAGVPAAARVWRAVVQTLSPPARREPSPDATRPRADRRLPTGPRIQRLDGPPSPPPLAVQTAAAAPAAEAAAAAGPATGSPPAHAASSSAALALFHRAHQLHFRQRDAAAALAAWDRYLQADPDGPLVLEARYNRALCLVRLGRAAEARAALQPFADGTLAHYRAVEARALVQSLAAPKLPASP
jgi:tetratricopeptide (TPR) repeat protein